MGDEQHGQAPVPLQLLQQRQHLGLGGHIQRGGRLVGDEQFRLSRQGLRQHHPLLHAAGELVGIVPHAPLWLGDAHRLQQFKDLVPPRPAGQPLVLAQGLADLRRHRQDGVKRGLRLLEDHGDAPPANLAHRPLRQRQQVDAVQQDGTRGDVRRARQQAANRQRGNGFATARLPQQGEVLPPFNLKIHAVNGMEPAAFRSEPHLQVSHFQQRAHQAMPLSGKFRNSPRF